MVPGFYDRLRKGARQSDAGALFCRCATVDSTRPLDRAHPRCTANRTGLLDDWDAKIDRFSFLVSNHRVASQTSVDVGIRGAWSELSKTRAPSTLK